MRDSSSRAPLCLAAIPAVAIMLCCLASAAPASSDAPACAPLGGEVERSVRSPALAAALAVNPAAAGNRANVRPEQQRAALQMFDLSPAVFVKNQGQRDRNTRCGPNAKEMDVVLTRKRPVSQFRGNPDGRGHTKMQRGVVGCLCGDADCLLSQGLGHVAAATDCCIRGDDSNQQSAVPGFRVAYGDILDEGTDLRLLGGGSGLGCEPCVGAGADGKELVTRQEGSVGFVFATLAMDWAVVLGETVDGDPMEYREASGLSGNIASDYQLTGGASDDVQPSGTYNPSVGPVPYLDSSWVRDGEIGEFARITRSTFPRYPGTMAVGDFNGDGKQDLAVAFVSSTYTKLKVYYSGHSEAEVNAGSGNGSVAAGDFNGDGYDDLATPGYGNYVSVQLKDPSGGFGLPRSTPVAEDPRHLAAADLDGDGNMDLAVICWEKLTVLYGVGDGTFGAREDYQIGTSSFRLTTGDFSGEGRKDIAILHSSASSSIRILYGQPAGGFGDEELHSVPGYAGDVTSGDFDGDGRLDLAASSFSGDKLIILYGQAGGTLGDRTECGGFSGPYGLAAGDFNGDAKSDLVIANRDSDFASILYGQAERGFSMRADYIMTRIEPHSVAVGDFDGNGIPGFAANCRGSAGDFSTYSSGVDVFFDRPGDLLIDGGDIDVGEGPSGLAAADINGDGRLDLVVPNKWARDVTVLCGQQGGGFGNREDFAVDDLPAGAVAADFDDDGLTDVCVGSEGFSYIQLLYGVSGGGLQAGQKYHIDYSPTLVISEDFDGDGRLDLAAGCTGSQQLSVLYGLAEGGFGRQVDIEAYPVDLKAGDFNCDGRVDLALTDRVDQTLVVMYCQSDGSFGGTREYDIGGDVGALACADFNGDGRLDLAVGFERNLSSELGVFYADGSGGFGGREDYDLAYSGNLSKATVGYLNKDGLPDIAACAEDGMWGRVLYGKPGGGFGGLSRFIFGSGAGGIVSGDFDDDGRGDVAVANSYDNNISVFYTKSYVRVFASDAEMSESAMDTANATVFRSGSRCAELPVDLTISGSAQAGVDFEPIAFRVVIPAGSASVSFEIVPTDDQEHEGPETIVIAVTEGTGYLVAIPSEATITIADDDPTVSLTASDAQASESGSDIGELVVSRTGPTDSSLIVRFEVSGTASGGVDYSSLGESVDIPPGASQVAVAVQPIDDSEAEGAETVVVRLSADASYFIGEPSSGTVTIEDDDLEVTPASFPNGTVGQFYVVTLHAAGGTSPYTWQIVSGQLPPGVTLDSAADRISGTPSAHGTCSFVLELSDSSNPALAITKDLSILVLPAELVLTTTSLAQAERGVSYTATLQANGGVAPYTWSLSSGQLPDGLALHAQTGTISGTPAALGTWDFTVRVRDSQIPPDSDEKVLSITIVPADLLITTASLPNAAKDVLYSQTLSATGGVSPYAWSVTVGALPAGLSLDASTGVVSGTPTTAGLSNFTVQVADSQATPATDSKALSIQTIEDTEAPLVSSVATVPSVVREGIDASLALTGAADDSTKGNISLTAAEYFTGADPGEGAGTAMGAADGAFDSPTEAVVATVNTSSWTAPVLQRLNVRARDAAGNWTSPAAYIDVPVVDGTSPAAPNNLALSAAPGLVKVYSGGWATAGTPVEEEQSTTIDLGATYSVAAVGLTPALPPRFFPREFAISASPDGSDWTALAQATNYAARAGEHLWQVEVEDYRYVKITALPRRNRADGHYYVEIAEIAVYESASGNCVRATWRATADDGNDASSGAASVYDLRYSTSAIDEAGFGSCAQVAGLPAPGPRGQVEDVICPVGSLTGRVYAALKVGDEVPNWSGLSNVASAEVGVTGVNPVFPQDEVTMGAGAQVQFAFSRGADVQRAFILLSDRPDFPPGPVRNPDGTLSRTVRALLRPGASWWKASAFQWKQVKLLASNTGTIYWRLEGRPRAYAAIYGPTRRIYFDCGDITGLSVPSSHPAGSDEAVWPDRDNPPAFAWTDDTAGMTYFYVDVSSDPSIPLGDAKRTATICRKGDAAGSYTPTKAEWKKIRKLATWLATRAVPDPAEGVLYWRVRAKDADKALSCASDVKTLVIDGGGFALDVPVDNGDGTWGFSWSHTGQGIAKYGLEFCRNDEFNASVRDTLKVPARSTTGTSCTLKPREVTRLRNFAARSGVTQLYWRVRGEDAEKAFVCYSDAVSWPVP